MTADDRIPGLQQERGGPAPRARRLCPQEQRAPQESPCAVQYINLKKLQSNIIPKQCSLKDPETTPEDSMDLPRLRRHALTRSKSSGNLLVYLQKKTNFSDSTLPIKITKFWTSSFLFLAIRIISEPGPQFHGLTLGCPYRGQWVDIINDEDIWRFRVQSDDGFEALSVQSLHGCTGELPVGLTLRGQNIIPMHVRLI